jgi:hypothetical protein
MKRSKDFNYLSGKKYDGMMGRCYRKKNASYKQYGARGIRVCSDWIEDINNFREWLSLELFNMDLTKEDFVKNVKQYQLDRIDVNGHYTPDNCRLTNRQQNVRNRRLFEGKVIMSAEGKEFKF